MLSIINSIIENKDYESLKEILQSDLISSQERSYLEYLDSSYKNSNTFPSQDLMHQIFPELDFSSLSQILSLSDLKVYSSNFLKQRSNLKQSQTLMQIATEVSQRGLIDSDLESLRSLIPTQVSDTSSISTLDDFKKFYQDKKNKPQGLITHIKEIDDLVGGIPYGNTLTVFAYVASYKSLLVNNIAYYNTYDLKYNGVILSLEVPKEQVLANIITRHSTRQEYDKYPFIATSKINRSSLSDEEEDYLFNTVLPDLYDYENHGYLKILDTTDFETFSPTEIRKVLVEVDDECRQKTGYPLDFFVIDHANLLKFSNTSSKDPKEQGNECIRFFNQLAQKFRLDPNTNEYTKLISIIVAQANRKGWERACKNKGVYTLNALADFNELERSSQAILSVFVTEEMKMSKEAIVMLLKNRFGPCTPDPVVVYAEPAAYTIGSEMEGFQESIEVDELESIFDGGSIADLL